MITAAADPQTTRGRRWLVLAAFLLLATALSTTTARPARAQGTTPAGTGPRLTLVGQTPWTAPTGEFRVQVLPQGLPAGSTIEADVHPASIGRIRFERSIRGEDLTRPLNPGPSPVPLDTAPRTAGGAVEIVVPVVRTGPVPDGGVLLSGPGVHPVVVTAIGPGGEELARLVTHLIRLPTADTEGPSLAVGTVLGIGGTVTPTEDDDLALDDTDTTQALATIDALTGHPSVALTVEPVPAVLAALESAAGGGGDPSPSATLAGNLAGRQILAAPYVQLDLGAWVAARLDPELDAQLAHGSAVTAALLGVTPDGRTAVADPSLTPEALGRLDVGGLDQVVVPTDQLVDPPVTDVTFTDVFELAAGEGSTLSAVTADPDLAARLRTTDDPVLNAHLVLADLSVLYNDAPRVSRGVALDLGADTDPLTITTLLAGLAQTAPPGSDGRPVVSPVTLDDLFRVTETATIAEQSRTTNLVLDYRSDPPAPLGSYPNELRATERLVAGYRSLTEPAPPNIAEPLQRALLLSGARSLGTTQRTDILRTVTDRIDAATAEIVAPLQQYVTLTSRSGKIPLNLENRLSYPVRIHLVLDSVKLEFPAGNVIDVELPAAATTRLDVEVTTRASGAFPLEVSVRSPDEVLDITSTSFTVRSTAISGAGLVLSIGAGVFLLVWWGRHFRKVRRARRLVASDHPVLSGPDTAR